jgi:hypothetical protein
MRRAGRVTHRRSAPAQRILVLVLALALPHAARAQLSRPPTSLDCDFNVLIAAAPATLEAPWLPYYPSVRLATLMPLVDAGAWPEVLDSVRASFERSAASFGPSAPDSAALPRFRHQLDSARARLGRLASAGSAADYAEQRRRLGPMVFATEMRDGRAELFRGTADDIVFTDSSAQGVRRTVCYHAAVTRAVLDRYTRPGRAAAAAFIEAKRVSWGHYFERGYSQLPWELYLNSLRARSGANLDPPTKQLILLHPSVGFEIPGRSIRDLTAQNAVALELLGWITYRNDYRDYLGLSGVVTFTERLGTGVGPFVHFGRVAKAGYIFRLRRTNADGEQLGDGLLISVDLYKYLSDRQAQLQKTLDIVRSKVGSE